MGGKSLVRCAYFLAKSRGTKVGLYRISMYEITHLSRELSSSVRPPLTVKREPSSPVTPAACTSRSS